MRRVQPGEKEGVGKVITLLLCTVRNQRERWFFSEVNKVQSGTDLDIDYYQHMGAEEAHLEPPSEGWIVGRHCCGIQPPPRLKGVGFLVPEGQEYNTLEHQLAK